MKFDITNPITQSLIVTSIKAALSLLGSVLPKADLKDIADLLLNKLEGLFPEGSIKDEIAEAVAAIVRSSANIPDSNPDN